ncbi:MAG TPA: site-specific integrase [Bacteroidales bacterium]|nr:site-specific integrase [Bacteroidales bacterium]
MATTKLLLQAPYKPVPKKDKAEHDPQGQNGLNGTKTGKKLNPYETRLYCFLIIDRIRIIKIKTEHVIYPNQWDFSKQLKKDKLAGAPEFNKKLLELKDEILLKYQNIIKDFPDLPFSKVAELLKQYGKGKEIPFLNNDKDFIQVLDEFILSMEGEVAPGTIKKFITLKKSLQELGKVNKKYETLSFSTIDHAFKDAFTKYLRNQAPRGRQKTRPEGFQYGLLNDTIGKYIECLKTFCKWSEERNYNLNDTYKEFSNFTKANRKRKKQGHDIVTLTLQELKHFYTFDFSDRPTLDRVRDLFCFGAYTGQRWSDIERLDKLEIHDDIWSFNAYKTKKETEIDLIGYAAPALDILKKYDYQLPKISLQKFNLYLKDAARIAGIDTQVKIRRYVGDKEIEISKPKHEYLGSHTARKTCVSILLNNYNMNVTHVLEITGHSDLKTLQKYINKDRKARRDAISKTKSITEALTIVKEKAG